MIFNVDKDRHKFSNWFVMHLITEHTEANDDVFSKFIDLHKEGKLEVKIFVGGEELDFQCAIDRLESQLDRMIENKAQDLVSNKLGDFFDKLHDMKKYFRLAIEAKLGFNLSEEF